MTKIAVNFIASFLACLCLTQCSSVPGFSSSRTVTLSKLGYQKVPLQKLSEDRRYSGVFKVNGKPMRFLIDSGANSTDLDKQLANIFGVDYGAVRKEGFIVESDKISEKGRAVFLSPVKLVWGDCKLKIGKWGNSTIKRITQKVINEASIVYSFDGSKNWEELTSDWKLIGVLNEISALIKQNENLKRLDKTALKAWSQKVAESKYVDGSIQSLDGQALQAKILLARQKSLVEGVASANDYFTSLKTILETNAQAKVNLFSLASNATKLSDAARAIGRAKMLTGKLK